MTYEEAYEAIQEFKQKGHTDEDVVEVLLRMYNEGLLSCEKLNNLLGLVGYHIDEKYYQFLGERKSQLIKRGQNIFKYCSKK